MVQRRIQMLLALGFVTYVIHRISQSNLNSERQPRAADRNESISSQDQAVTDGPNQGNKTKEAACVIPEYDYKGVSMDDPHLVDYIRRELLHPPSPLPYSLKDPKKVDFSQFGQSKYAAGEILRGMRGGFFVEAGALDGEFISNTLYFEKELGWRGLLVEPDPETYKLLRQKHRNAFTINAALSTTPEATDLTLEVKDEIFGHAHLSKEGVKVKGIPLYSILLALEIKVVDFFSLDVESFEVKVLETIPWDKVQFRLMCIEINHIPEGLDHLAKYLTDKGYKFLGVREIDAWFGWPRLLEEQTMKT